MREMTRATLYLETSVIGSAASRISRDAATASRQRATRTWFAVDSPRFELFTSQLVVVEISRGDAAAAKERLTLVAGIPLLEQVQAADDLAAELLRGGAVPAQAGADAMHVALAAVHGVQYLLTWNCKHIANASRRLDIEQVCMAAGFEPPVICTPEELTDEQGRR